GGAQVHARHAGAVRVDGRARPQHHLEPVVGTGGDVTAHVVAVVPAEVGGRPVMARPYPRTEARCEALDLGQDWLPGGALVAGGPVGVGPQGMQVAGRTGGVGEVLLSNEDEGALRQAAGRDLPLDVRDLLQRPTKVDGRGLPAQLVRPRYAALDGEVE